MALDNTYQPPVTYPIRPLTKGMRRNLPSNGIPEGSFLRAQNYRVREFGLERRGGFAPFNLNPGTTEPTAYDEQLLDLIYFWSGTSSPEMLLLGKEHLMKLESDNSVTKIYSNITEPTETSYTISNVDVGGYDSDLRTLTLSIGSFTENEAEGIYVGSDFYWDDGTEKYFGTVIQKTFDTDHINLTLTPRLKEEPTDFPEAGDLAYVRQSFITAGKMDVTFAVLPPASYGDSGKIVFADQRGNGLLEYSEGVLNTFETESSVDGESASTQYLTSANVLAYFEDRLFVGNTIEQGQSFVQRVRWSDPVNFSRFQPANYIDLPYSGGELIQIKPLGPLLVLYFTDAIYIGRATNIAGRPYQFERMETGDMGLITQRAIVSWNDSHVFVGTDNIYTLSMNGALEPIGSPLLAETLEYTKNTIFGENFIQVEHDPSQESIVFLFPDVEEGQLPYKSISTKLWRLNYKSKEWSYDEVFFTDTSKTSAKYYFTGLLSSRVYTAGRTWEDWEGSDSENDESAVWAWMPLMSASTDARAETYNLETMTPVDPDTDIFDSSVVDGNSFFDKGSWDMLKTEVIQSKKLYIPVYRTTQEDLIIVEESDREDDSLGDFDADADEVTYAIWSILESMDYDFGAPDTSKTVTRYGVKVFDNNLQDFGTGTKAILDDLTFKLYMSDRMGYTWKRPVSFRFKKKYNEGFANFLATGSTFRFKLVNSQKILPFKLSEMTLRVQGRGLQVTN